MAYRSELGDINLEDGDKPIIEAIPAGRDDPKIAEFVRAPPSSFIKGLKSVWTYKLLLWLAMTGLVIFLWVWVGVYHRNAVANYLYRYVDESDGACDTALGAIADADDDDSTDYCLEVDHIGNTIFLLPAGIGASVTWVLWTLTMVGRMWWSYQKNEYNEKSASLGYRYIISNISTFGHAFGILKFDVDKHYHVVFMPLNIALWYTLGQSAGIADTAVWILIAGFAVVYGIFGLTFQVVNRYHYAPKRDGSGKLAPMKTQPEWIYLILQGLTYLFVFVVIWAIGYGYAVDNTHEKHYVHFAILYATLYYLLIEISWSVVHVLGRFKYPKMRLGSFYARWGAAVLFHVSYWVIYAILLRNQRFTV